MANEIDAVIAALEVELQQAEKDKASDWPRERCNRWIRQLRGGWRGRWSNLKIEGFYYDVTRTEFITHVKATLAYLEAKRGEQRRPPAAWPWPFAAFGGAPSGRTTHADEPVDAEFTEVPPQQRKLPKPKVVR